MSSLADIQKKLWNIFSSNLPYEYDIEVLRKIFLFNILIVVGIFFLGLLGIIAFVQQNFLLGSADIIVLLIFISLFVYLRKTRDYDLVSIIGITFTFFFYCYLVASGGVNNTAHIWALTFPLVSFFLLGIKRGFIFSLMLFLFSLIVFVWGSQISFFTSYDVNLKIRFLAVYLAVMLFALVMETTRKSVQNRLRISNIELLKAVSELKNANKVKSELMNFAVHDLKNPLANIQNSAELLISKKLDEKDKDELISMIKSSTYSMLILISDLLDSSEIESPEILLKWEKIELSELLKDSVEEYKFTASQKNQKIIIESEEKIYFIGDYIKLSLAFKNIISNSIKYSNFGSSIKIKAQKEAKWLLIQFMDKGVGFSKDDMDKVFGKFQRLSAKPTAGESSTGLGLSIVKSIIELHYGSVWIESEKGVGTKFFVQLPINQANHL